MNPVLRTPPAVLFDLDGTLIDSARDLSEAVNRVRAYWSAKPLSIATITGYIGNGLLPLLRRALADIPTIGESEIVQAREKFEREYRTCALDATRPYPGIRSVLERLQAARCPMAVVSNKPEAFCRHILEGLALDRFFPLVIGGDTVSPPKPHPAPLQSALAHLGADPANAWMVGDNWTDLDAAAACGLRSVFCTYGLGRADGRLRDACISRPEELLTVVLRIERPRQNDNAGISGDPHARAASRNRRR